MNAHRRRLDGGKRTTDGKKAARNKRKTKGEGGRLFVFALLLPMRVCKDNLNLVPHPSAKHTHVAALISELICIHLFIYIYIYTVNMFMKQPGTVV